MMQRVLLSVIVAVAAFTAVGQTHYVPHVWIGGHAGMTLSEMSFSPSVKQKLTEGVTAGVSFRYEEERHVGLLAEFNVVQRG